MGIERYRKSMNITTQAFDDELRDVVEAARHDMIMSGVPAMIARDDNVEGVVQAIKCYLRAEQSWEEPSIAKGQAEAYRAIVNKLALTYGNKAGCKRDGQ